MKFKTVVLCLCQLHMKIAFKVEQRSKISYLKGHKIPIIKLNYIKIEDMYICSKSLTQTSKQYKETIQSFCTWHQASTHESKRNMEIFIKRDIGGK